MKAHLIDTHLLVPRSRSSAKVKVKYKAHVSQKMGVSVALVFHKHILFLFFFVVKVSFIYYPAFPKQALVFTCLQYKSLENTVKKGEIARNEQFLLFPQCFLPIWRTSTILIKSKIVVCKLFQFGRVISPFSTVFSTHLENFLF